MSRLIFWLALACLVVFAVRSKIRQAQQRHREQFRQPPPGPQPQPPFPQGQPARAAADAETMLQCAHCGIFYPASETVQARGRDYCSAAHATLPAA
jgi:uncharacterized protein